MSELERDDIVVVVVAVAAAIGCAFADAAPTGLGWWDAVLRFCFGGVAVLAASRAQRWALIVFAGAAVAVSGATSWTLVGGFALLVALLMAVLDRRDRSAAVVIGGLGAQVLLRLPPNFFFGFDSILTTIVTLVLMWSGFQYGRRVERKWARRIAAGLVVGAMICVASLALTVVAVRPNAERGVTSARTGLAAVRAGDVPRTLAALGDAQQSFGSASDRLGSVLALPGRLLPVAGQHLAALKTASDEGANLSAAAAAAAQSADVTSIAASRGSVDVAALRTMAPQLSLTAEALVDGRNAMVAADNPWLVPQVADRLDSLRVELEDAAPEAALAAAAAEQVPALLGADRPMRYFVIFASPAESREMGGFIGSYALVEADRGRLRKVESGRTLALYSIVEETGAVLDHPVAYPDFFQRLSPVLFPQNLTGLPDLGEVARAVGDVFPTLGGAPIDGVMYLDPYAVAAILTLTGPIEVEGIDEVLTSNNVAEFLVREQYIRFDSTAERFDFLTKVLDATFSALSEADLPGPERLGEVLGPAARSSRLQMVTFDDRANEFLRGVKLLNPFPAPDGSDFLAVLSSNAAPNKLDAYMERLVNYEVELDPVSGALHGTVRVLLSSVVPPGLPPYVVGREEFEGVLPGENRTKIILYTPHKLSGASIDDEPAFTGWTNAYGYNRYTLTPTVRPNESTQLVFTFDGTINLDDGYRLTMPSQPVVNDVVATVSVRTRGGFPGRTTFTLDEDTELQWQLN